MFLKILILKKINKKKILLEIILLMFSFFYESLLFMTKCSVFGFIPNLYPKLPINSFQLKKRLEN